MLYGTEMIQKKIKINGKTAVCNVPDSMLSPPQPQKDMGDKLTDYAKGLRDGLQIGRKEARLEECKKIHNYWISLIADAVNNPLDVGCKFIEFIIDEEEKLEQELKQQ